MRSYVRWCFALNKIVHSERRRLCRTWIPRKNLVLRNKITFNQGGRNQFLRPLQELSIWIMSETAAAAFCWVVFSSAEGFRTEIQEFASFSVPRNEIPSSFLFCCRVGKEIQRVRFYFWSTERNSELFSLPRKGSEWDSNNFVFHGKAGIPSIPSSAKKFFC